MALVRLQVPAGYEAQLATSREHGLPGWVAPGRLAGGVSRPVCHALAYLRRVVCRTRRLRAAAAAIAAAGTLVLAGGCSSGAGGSPAWQVCQSGYQRGS